MSNLSKSDEGNIMAIKSIHPTTNRVRVSMTPEIFAQTIVSIEKNYGLRLDARSAWIRMDEFKKVKELAVGKCNEAKGWYGMKGACKRGAKHEGIAKVKESRLEIANKIRKRKGLEPVSGNKTEGKGQEAKSAPTDAHEESFRNIVAHTYGKDGITKEKLKALDSGISRNLTPDEIGKAKDLFTKAIDPTKNEDHVLRTTKEVLQIELSKDHYKEPKDRNAAIKQYAIVRKALNDVDDHQKGAGLEEFTKIRTHDKKMSDWVDARAESNRKKNKKKGTKKK